MGLWPCVNTNKEIVIALHNHCKKNNYHCATCRYGVAKLGLKNRLYPCIFGNLPCDWDVSKDWDKIKER